MTIKNWKRHDAVVAFVGNIPASLRVEIMNEALDVEKLLAMTDAELLRIPGVGRARMIQLRTLLELYRQKSDQWA